MYEIEYIQKNIIFNHSFLTNIYYIYKDLILLYLFAYYLYTKFYNEKFPLIYIFRMENTKKILKIHADNLY